jgi:hypothetical protein
LYPIVARGPLEQPCTRRIDDRMPESRPPTIRSSMDAFRTDRG